MTVLITSKFCMLYLQRFLIGISLLHIVFQHFPHFSYLHMEFQVAYLNMSFACLFFYHSTWNHTLESLIRTDIFLSIITCIFPSLHFNFFWITANTSKTIALYKNLFIPHLNFGFHKIQMSVKVILLSPFIRSLLAIKSPHTAMATQTLITLRWKQHCHWNKGFDIYFIICIQLLTIKKFLSETEIDVFY